MDKELELVLTRLYGTQIRRVLPELDKRIVAIVTSTLFAGTVGSNPMCKLNRALEEMTKDM